MNADKSLEIEVKFRIKDPAKIAGKLKKIGAKKVSSGFEKNILFDRNGEIGKAGDLLRLRLFDGKADITFKKFVPHEKFKVREENIVFIDSFEKGKRLLESMGFRESRKYEKKRQTFECDGAGILVDELPFMGSFVEIEGTEEKIIEMAGKLGLDMKDAITKDYRQLFLEYCKRHGMEGRELVFGGKK